MSIRFASRWLFVVSIVLALQGVSWIVVGSFDPFGIYDRMLAQTVLGQESLTVDQERVFSFAVALLGATDAAFFLMFALVVRYAFAQAEPWAWMALCAGLLSWFLLDSGYSLAVGAIFNIYLVNVPCLVLVGTPLLLTVSQFNFLSEVNRDRRG